jgi:hypothetical protein
MKPCVKQLGVKQLGLSIFFVAVLLMISCSSKKVVSVHDVFSGCALRETLIELKVKARYVRTDEDYGLYALERLCEKKDYRRYPEDVWEKLREKTIEAAKRRWNRVYAKKIKKCRDERGYDQGKKE